MPFVSRCCRWPTRILSVFGSDYPTKDGTGARQGLHSRYGPVGGHIAALDKVGRKDGLHIYNLGTGNGSSVLHMYKAFEQASGKEIRQ